MDRVEAGESTTNEKSNAARCRIYGTQWATPAWLLLIYAPVTASVLCQPGRPGNSALLSPTAATYLALFIVLLCGLWIGRDVTRYVEADERGLRWRGLFGSRSVAWADVTDYYRTLPTEAGRGNGTAIETRVGTVRFPGPRTAGTWRGGGEQQEALRVVVARNAASARARGWNLRGTRPEDEWPRTFRYATPTRRRALFLLALGTVAYLAAVTTLLVPRIGEWRASMGAHWGNVYGFCWIVFAAFPLLVAVPYLASLAETYRRRRESIRVTPDAVAWTDGTAAVEVSWGEVGDYFVTPRGRYALALRGGDERQVEFDGRLEGHALLREIVARYAPDTGGEAGGAADDAGPWRRRAIADTPRWSLAANGTGGQTYRYRGIRILAALPLLLFAIHLPVVPLMNWLDPERPIDPPPFWFYTPWIALAVWGWWVGRTARIEVDDFGITQFTTFGRQNRILWIGVADYRDWQGSDPHTVIGNDGTRIRFSSLIDGGGELRREIARRAPVPKTGWTRPTRRPA